MVPGLSSWESVFLDGGTQCRPRDTQELLSPKRWCGPPPPGTCTDQRGPSLQGLILRPAHGPGGWGGRGLARRGEHLPLPSRLSKTPLPRPGRSGCLGDRPVRGRPQAPRVLAASGRKRSRRASAASSVPRFAPPAEVRAPLGPAPSALATLRPQVNPEPPGPCQRPGAGAASAGRPSLALPAHPPSGHPWTSSCKTRPPDADSETQRGLGEVGRRVRGVPLRCFTLEAKKREGSPGPVALPGAAGPAVGTQPPGAHGLQDRPRGQGRGTGLLSCAARAPWSLKPQPRGKARLRSSRAATLARWRPQAHLAGTQRADALGGRLSPGEPRGRESQPGGGRHRHFLPLLAENGCRKGGRRAPALLPPHCLGV